MRGILIAVVALAAGACVSPATAPARGPRADPVAMLGQADVNRDGAVTREEFRASRDGLFSTLDRNHDGYVSKDDSGRRRRRGGGERLQQLIAALDANRDGQVSRSEFVDGPARRFTRADGNADGVIDGGELSALQAAVSARRGGD